MKNILTMTCAAALFSCFAFADDEAQAMDSTESVASADGDCGCPKPKDSE